MGTLLWMRCTNVDMSHAARHLPVAFARTFEQEMADRGSGVLPDDRFVDVQFDDVVRDPVGTVGDIYERLGWEFGEAARTAVAEYAAHKPRGSRGAHRYSLESTGLDAARERERFGRYMTHYGIRVESA